MKVTKKIEDKKKKTIKETVTHNKLIWFVCMLGDYLYRLQLIEKYYDL
jgi:sugar phosphate permease